MNYYERHLGDYAKDTAHLSMLEHGAYNLLLDRYYSTEHGIEADQVHRLCRARTKEERAALDVVLQEFFSLQEGVWLHKRAEEEIARFHASRPDEEAKRENTRDRQRRTRERRKQLFDELRELGMVPAYDTPMHELQDTLSRIRSQPVTPPVTRDATAIHTPDTRHHTPEEKEKTPLPPKGGAVHGFPPGFDTFWQAYPRKTAKPQAAKAFARLRPDDALLSQMLLVLALQRETDQWKREGGQFIPHASTWLNNRRWEDEMSPLATQKHDPFVGAL